MKGFKRTAIALVLFSCSVPATAQTFKCLNAAGKATCSNATCDLLGTRDAGED